MITGVNFLALIHQRIPETQKYDRFGGTFDQVKPFLLNAYAEVLEEIRPMIPENIRDELIQIIAQLCHPVPELRGNPRGIAGVHTPYSLERYISIVDRLSKKASRS